VTSWCSTTLPFSALHSSANTRLTSTSCLMSALTGRRIITSREVPKLVTWISPKPICSTM
jgi:hypothetical protein